MKNPKLSHSKMGNYFKALVVLAASVLPICAQDYLRPIDAQFEKDTVSVPVVYPGPRNVTADPLPALDVNSRESVAQFYRQLWPSQQFPDLAMNWSGSYETKSPGDLSTTWRKLVLTRINAYRALAGVPVYEGTNQYWDTYAQDGAFALSINGVLSHDLSPAVAGAYWTHRAAVAVVNANLAATAAAANTMLPVDALICDYGAENFSVGHRSRVLDPRGKNVGIGHVPFWKNERAIPSANSALSSFAMMNGYDWAQPENNPPGSKRDRFVTWPSRGYFPLQIMNTARWSVMNDLWAPTANLSKATVTVYQDGKKLSTAPAQQAGLQVVTLIDPQQAQGGIHPWNTNPTITRPEPSSYPAFPGRDVRFTIRVGNLTDWESGAVVPDYVYNVVVFDAMAAASQPAKTLVDVPELAGLKFTGSAVEVLSDIKHPNGNIYDQLLLTGSSATFCADAGQMTRLSFVDLDDDIVQVEFSGKGRVRIELDAFSGPALPKLYNQAVSYVKGHARIYVLDGDADTWLSVFSVGKANAVNPTLFLDGVVYDGIADIALVAVATNAERIGGLLLGNVNFFASSGFTGVYAPNIAISHLARVGDISAFDDAIPVLLTGAAQKIEITGGSLQQPNKWPVMIGDVASVVFSNGATSHAVSLPRQANKATLFRNDTDVTASVVH